MSWVIEENWAGPVLDKDPKFLGWVQILPKSDLILKIKIKMFVTCSWNTRNTIISPTIYSSRCSPTLSTAPSQQREIKCNPKKKNFPNLVYGYFLLKLQ